MSDKRKEATAFMLKYIDKLMPGSPNTKLYEDMFAGMSDKEFDAFMKKLEEGTVKLAIIAPNLSKHRLDVDRNLAIAKELGHDFFQRLWMDDGDGTPRYLTPVKYMVVQLPIRRQAQLLEKKISIPEDNRSVDDLTGQPTGKSKGSKISYPETQVLAAKNLDSCLTEMLKYRGGDTKGFNAMNASIAKTGTVNLDAIAHLAGGVKSTQTLHTLLTGMHLSNTLV